MRVLDTLARFASRHFSLLVAFAAVCGWLEPAVFSWVGPSIAPLLGTIMFGMGMTLDVHDFKALAAAPRDVLVGAAAQFTFMPLIALAVAEVFALPPALAVGVILVGSCPGGTASNVVTFLARGDVALSVAITSVSTLLAPVMTPLLVGLLAGRYITVDVAALFVSVAKIVLVPVALGVAVNAWLGARVRTAVSVLPLLSVAAIMLIVAFVIGANRARLVETSWLVLAAVALHNLAGMAAGYGIGTGLAMAPAKRRALCFEVGMQNSGLAVALATLHFDPAAALPGAVFSLWHNLSGPALAAHWARRASPGRAGFDNPPGAA